MKAIFRHSDITENNAKLIHKWKLCNILHVHLLLLKEHLFNVPVPVMNTIDTVVDKTTGMDFNTVRLLLEYFLYQSTYVFKCYCI